MGIIWYLRSVSFLLLWRFEDLKWTHQRLIHAHHSTRILKLPTVVGSTENCHQLPLRKELVSLLYHLMGSAHQVNVMFFQESSHDVTAEDKTDSPFVLGPTRHSFLWICPEKIAKKSLVRYFQGSHQLKNLLETIELRTQASMHT